mmetsp:Transcript_2265/g.5667  ORF Transcript_2265/g.5667 Transcript_2265/m.5667 type:complete len:86 (+) Transcript_2265:415-672(+)
MLMKASSRFAPDVASGAASSSEGLGASAPVCIQPTRPCPAQPPLWPPQQLWWCQVLPHRFQNRPRLQHRIMEPPEQNHDLLIALQ